MPAKEEPKRKPGRPRIKPFLAIDGGEKVLRRPLPKWPAFDRKASSHVLRVMRSGKVNYWTGGEGRAFEEEFADWLGARNAVSVSSGTAALHVALAALGVGPGDEVICTPYSFMASAMCALQAGAVPVFADVGTDHIIDPAQIEHAITPRTKAIVVVHLYGIVADMDPIMDIACRHGLFVVEDCAQCLGGRYKGRMVGTIGDVGCFSFCQNKHITTGGEGGMVCCDDDAIARECRSLRDHGSDVEARLEAERKGIAKPVSFRRVGYNFRMTEIQSAIGRVELARLDFWNIPLRRRFARDLIVGLKDHPLVKYPPVHTEERESSFWLVPFVLDKTRLKRGKTVRKFVQAVQAEGVGAYMILWPLAFGEKVFRDRRGFGARDYPFGDPAFGKGIDYGAISCPVAKSLAENTIGFWVHPTYNLGNIRASVTAFNKVASVFMR